MGKRRGKRKSNIDFFPDRMRFIIKSRNYNNSKLIRDLNLRYPDRAINLRTFLRNMQDGTIDPLILDWISQILNITPDYLTGQNNYENIHRAEILTRYPVLESNESNDFIEDPDGIIIEPYKWHSIENNAFNLRNLWNEYFRAYTDHIFSEFYNLPNHPEISKDDFVMKHWNELELKTDDLILESIQNYIASVLKEKKKVSRTTDKRK